jgi:hypothetical protein
LPIWANFRQRALDVAIREINNKTDYRLRQPVFLGIREDKNASEVIRGEGRLSNSSRASAF